MKTLFKLGLLIIATSLLTSCSEPVLEKHEYTIIDTVDVSRNGFNKILSYDVYIKLKQDSSIHYGEITPDGDLVRVNIKSLDPKIFEK